MRLVAWLTLLEEMGDDVDIYSRRNLVMVDNDDRETVDGGAMVCEVACVSWRMSGRKRRLERCARAFRFR